MMDNKVFLDGLLAWAIAFRFTNMWSERCLARIRQSVDGHDACVERTCSSGFLAQIVTEHKARGGADPRCPSRKQLLQDGVALRCKPADIKASKPRGPYVNFMMKEEAARKASGATLDRTEYLAWQKQKVAEFHSLSAHRRALQVAEAQFAHRDKLAGHGEDDEPAKILPQRPLSTVLDIVGDLRTPYRAEAFRTRVRNTLGLSEELVVLGNGGRPDRSFHNLYNSLKLRKCMSPGE
jgi:hypothetical protein